MLRLLRRLMKRYLPNPTQLNALPAAKVPLLKSPDAHHEDEFKNAWNYMEEMDEINDPIAIAVTRSWDNAVVDTYFIHRCQVQSKFLESKAQVFLSNITAVCVKMAGAGRELSALQEHLNEETDLEFKHLRFSLYKIKGYSVVEAISVKEPRHNAYYSTLLWIPNGRFGVEKATYDRPTQSGPNTRANALDRPNIADRPR